MESDSSFNITSVEMLSMGGFALFFGWMFTVFFWLFCDFPPGVPLAVRDLVQLTVFAGIPAAYAVVHVLAKKPEFNVFSMPVKVGEAVCAVALPGLALAMHLGLFAPLVGCVRTRRAGRRIGCVHAAIVARCVLEAADNAP